MSKYENPFNHNIGLKGCLKPYKGCKLSYKLERLRWNLRYAWKRAWIGYDDVDMFECFEVFRCRMILILEDFKKHSNGSWNLPKESEHYDELLRQFPEDIFLKKRCM